MKNVLFTCSHRLLQELSACAFRNCCVHGTSDEGEEVPDPNLTDWRGDEAQWCRVGHEEGGGSGADEGGLTRTLASHGWA